jgi:hypothetical protein
VKHAAQGGKTTTAKHSERLAQTHNRPENSERQKARSSDSAAQRASRGAPRNYRNGQAKDWKPLEWHGYYSLRRGIATQLNTMTRNHMAAKGLLRHSSANTTLIHYIKDVPEVTADGMAQVEQLFSELDSGEQEVQ